MHRAERRLQVTERAPDTGTRNTVHRGPKRDLVKAYAEGIRKAGMRFGTYYSGGLDWFVRPDDPIGLRDDYEITERPNDMEYAKYAAEHVRDLMRRFSPDILWNDIEWPDAGKDFGPHGIGTVFQEYYAMQPEGLVDDRWHVPHSDYLTSEYQHMLDNEGTKPWENCRGLGLSFAYNKVEGQEHALSPVDAMKHLIDVTLRGGRLLLGVGPKADGSLPEWQSKVVARIGQWMEVCGPLLETLQAGPTLPGESFWQRAGIVDGWRILFVDADEPVEVHGSELITPDWATLDGTTLSLDRDRPGPAALRLV